MVDNLLIIGGILKCWRVFNSHGERRVRLYATFESPLDIRGSKLVRRVEASPNTRCQAFGNR